jgi:hypothetical protein
MLVVLTNVLNPKVQQAIANFSYKNGYAGNTDRYLKGTKLPHNKLLKIAQHWFPEIKIFTGYELWANTQVKPTIGWHKDKDEILYKKKKLFRFPICSIVYFPKIEKMTGGEFETASATIKPESNMMIIFESGLRHRVKPWTGHRMSVAINPWYNMPLSVK